MPKNQLFQQNSTSVPLTLSKFIWYELLDEVLLLKTREQGHTANNAQVTMGNKKKKKSEERVRHEESSGCIFRTRYRPEVPLMRLEVKTCVLQIGLI